MEETKKLGYDTTCPFNPAHLLPGESLQKHLLKCRKQHKSSNQVVCPFNQTHYMPTREYAKHIKECPDRILIEACRYTEKTRGGNANQTEETAAQSSMANHNTETSSYNGNDEENWDDMDVPAYNPLKYCLENKVIRQARHLTPAEKRAFYEEERIRHQELSKRMQKATNKRRLEDPIRTFGLENEKRELPRESRTLTTRRPSRKRTVQ